jgi:hypothetical protein
MQSQAKRTKPSGQGPTVGHLDTLTGILKEMGCVYREMRHNSTPIADGAKLIYSLRCMRDVIETITLQKLEEKMDVAAQVAVERVVGQRPEGTALQ